MTQPVRQYDDFLISHYEEQYCSRADQIYRFAFALTLSLDGAKQLVDQTFQEVAANLEQLQAIGTRQPMGVLVAACYRAFAGLKSRNFKEGRSAITQALKPLSIEERAALAGVDVCGLTASDAAKAFQIQEVDLRRFLARARRGLMMSSLDN